MSVKKDVVNLQVNVGNDAARNQLNELHKSAARVRGEMENLGKRTKEFAAKKQELAAITAQMDKLKQTIGITALTQKELVAEQKKILALRNSLPPFTAEWKKYDDQLKQVKSRLYDVNNGVQGFASLWSRVGDEVKKFGALAVGYLGFQFITQQFSSLIKGAGALSDSLANIQKVTNLTAEQVKGLNEELKQMDTRTSTEGLRQLAYEAGKLGIQGTENLLGFVRAADMIQVALGEDLGKGATLAIGKIATVYKAVEQFGVEEGMLRIGSAINSIGMASTAQESFLVEFAKRLGGIAVPANISAAQIIGLAGTMDSLGQTAEVSTTALGNTIGKLVSDFKGFAQVSGLTEDALKRIYSEEGGLGALKAVLQGVQNQGGDFEQLVTRLGDIGIEGSRAKAVLGVLANNLGELDRQVKIAEESFAAGTSIIDEFNIKNQTLGATIDKLSKEFNKLVSSSTIQNFLKALVEGTFQLVKGLQEVPKWINKNITAVTLFATALAVLTLQKKALAALTVIETTVLKLFNREIALGTIAAKANMVATTAWGVVTAIFTGNIKKLAAEYKLLRILIGTNPLGVLLIALGAAALAFNALNESMTKVVTKQKLMNDINKAANESIAQEKGMVMQLTAIINDNSISLDTRKKALNDLIKINPDYLKGLTLENIKTAEGTKMLERYNRQLFAKAQLEAAQGRITDLAKQDLDLAEEIRDKKSQLPTARTDYGAGGNRLYSEREELQIEIKTAQKKREALKEELKKITDLQTTITQEQNKAETENLNYQKNLMMNRLYAINREIKAYKEGTSEYKKLFNERQNLKQQINDLYGKTPGSSVKIDPDDMITPAGTETAPGGGGTKSFKDTADDLRKQFLAFYDQLAADASGAQLSGKAVELFNAELEAKQGLQKLEDFFNRGVVSELEFTEAKKAIEQKLEQTLDEINLKYQKPMQGKMGAIVARQFLPDRADAETMINMGISGAQEAGSKVQRGAAAQLSLAASAARTNRDRLDVELAYLQQEKEARLANHELLLSEKQAIEAEYREREKELNAQFLMDQFQQWLNVAQQMSNLAQLFVDRRMAKEQAAFNREKRMNDQKRNLYKQQLDGRLISQAQYDKKMAELQVAEDKRKAELEKKQFERQKKMQIIQAIISGAQAVMSSLAAVPGLADIMSLGAARALMISMAVATTAAQVALISRQQPPEMGKGGKLRNGPKHSHRSRGLPVVNPITGQVEALLEQNEGIVSSNTMDDNTVYSATGTPSQIASTLNGINGGNTWDSPATVRPISQATAASRGLPGWVAQQPAAVRPIRIMQQGGMVGQPANASANMQAFEAKMDMLVNGFFTLSQEVSSWRRDLHAVVSIKEYREQEALYDAAIVSDAL